MTPLGVSLCISFLLSVSSVASSPQGFKPDAGSQVTAGYKYLSQPKRSDIGHLLVEWNPVVMLSASEVPRSPLDQWLEVQSGTGQWERVEGAPFKKRTGSYRWFVPVVPCLQHRVKLSVVTQAGTNLSYTVPNPVPAATQEEMENSKHKFTPRTVGELVAEATNESSVRLSWEESPCADMYEVYIDGKNEDAQERSTNTNSLTVTGLEHCTDYEISVYANLASESSDETMKVFTTPPQVDAADSIVASVGDTVSGKPVNVTWTTPASLKCVPLYSVSVCDQAEVCSQQEEVPNVGTGKQMHYMARNLEKCSKYTVRILPKLILPGRHLQPQLILPAKPLQAKLIELSTRVEGCAEEVADETGTEPQTEDIPDVAGTEPQAVDIPDVSGTKPQAEPEDPAIHVDPTTQSASPSSSVGSSASLTVLGVTLLLAVSIPRCH